MKKSSKLSKQSLKKNPEELQMYLHFKKRGFAIKPKKGKGSFSRKKKYKEME